MFLLFSVLTEMDSFWLLLLIILQYKVYILQYKLIQTFFDKGFQKLLGRFKKLINILLFASFQLKKVTSIIKKIGISNSFFGESTLT